jgi:PadR family transcriptional regulator PadR
MGGEKSALAGSAAMLILKLLEERDMYGYQMIEELRRRSDHTFDLKAGTLYPLLHGLEEKGWITAYQDNSDTARPRKYYHLTKSGTEQLKEKQEDWRRYARAVERVLEGGVCFG